MQSKVTRKQTPDPWNGKCPSRAVLNLIGDKWAMLIFPLLRARPYRNSELLRAVDGISQKMLTETSVPPKVDYRLTDLGTTLADALSVVDQWVVDHYHEMAAEREKYLRRESRAAARSQHSSSGIYRQSISSPISPGALNLMLASNAGHFSTA